MGIKQEEEIVFVPDGKVPPKVRHVACFVDFDFLATGNPVLRTTGADHNSIVCEIRDGMLYIWENNRTPGLKHDSAGRVLIHPDSLPEQPKSDRERELEKALGMAACSLAYAVSQHDEAMFDLTKEDAHVAYHQFGGFSRTLSAITEARRLLNIPEGGK